MLHVWLENLALSLSGGKVKCCKGVSHSAFAMAVRIHVCADFGQGLSTVSKL